MILLHTMATPDRDPAGALALAAELGLDGIELVCQDGYRCGLPPGTPLSEAHLLRRRAEDSGLRVGGLVPYAKDQNHPDPARRAAAVDELTRCVHLAAALGAPLLRVFAGAEVSDEDWPRALSDLAASLRKVAAAAEAAGVTLAIENHMDTMATTASRTMEIWRAVGHPAVGVLYDPANLAFMQAEGFDEALAIQLPAIRHVHVKDLRWETGGKRRAALPGKGIVPWPRLVATLAAHGYAGPWSLEYEARWFPDELPPAEEGLVEAASYLAACLARAKAEAAHH